MSEKIVNIERLRIIAAFGIVWFHTEGAYGRTIGYAGLPIFIMMFCMLITVKKSETYRDFVAKKAKRLLLPWIFWCLIYLVVGVAKAYVNKKSISDTFPENVFLTGTSIHLWYLPFSFFIALAINRIQRINIKLSSNSSALLTAILGTFTVVLASFMLRNIEILVPIAQWIFGLPACIIGFGIGTLLRDNNKKGIIFVVSIVTIVCLVMQLYQIIDLAVPYCIGTILLVVAIFLQGKIDKFTQYFAPLTFGIYLIHPIILLLVTHVPFLEKSLFAQVIISFFVASLITKVLKSTILRHYIL